MQLAGVTISRRPFAFAKRAAAVAIALWAVAGACALVLASLPGQDGSLRLAAEMLGDTVMLILPSGALAVLAAAAGYLAALARPTTTGVIRVGEEGIALEAGGNAERIAHEEIRAGRFVRERSQVELRLARGDVIRIGVAPGTGSAAAGALLDAIAAGGAERALELAVQQRATAGRILAAFWALPAAAGALFAASLLDSPAIVVAAAALFGALWFLLITRFGAPKRLVAGHDGVALEGVRGQSFLPWARIDGIVPAADGVAIELDDLTEVQVPLLPGGRRHAGDLAERRRDQLLARARAGLDAWRKGSGEPLGAALLDRGGRSLAAWRESLRDLATRPAGGYRAASLDPDHLTQVLWSPDVAPERRLGAALALSASEDPALARRVRVFVDSCADEDLRAAVERAAEGELDEEALVRAVARPR